MNRRRFLVDDKDCANGKNQRLQDRPEDLGGASEAVCDIAGALMGCEMSETQCASTAGTLIGPNVVVR